jgi:hypothetical protein
MPQPQDISRLRARRDAAQAAAMAADEHLRRLDAAVSRAERAGQAQEAARLRAERAASALAGQAELATYARVRDEAFGQLVDWLAQTPEQIVEACSDDWPFVLLPVRIETKFVRTSTGADLRVRFFPDEISVAAPLGAVSEAERALGIAYWRARAAARHEAGDDSKRAAYRGAWTALATEAGAYRAGYIVRATTPVNTGATPDDLQFPDPIVPDEPPLARADLLPDRFVVLTYTADPTTRALREVNRAVGAPIPDNLMLASQSEHADSWITRDENTGRLIVPDALSWLVDFDAAVAVGMAVRIPLTHPHDTHGFDRVVALGVRSATPPAEGPAALQKLLAKHRYGEGCGIVPSGTPTNNTESPSGWQPASADAQELFDIEDAPPDLAPTDGLPGAPDGSLLGELLGLDAEFVGRLPHAGRTDVAEAKAMNRAAAPGTLDQFVEGFLKGLVSPQTAADLHRFFVTWVSGRGQYPVLRIGRQPYGIVVTSAWGAWKFPADAGPAAHPDIAALLYDQIAEHRFRWQVLARAAPHAAQTGGDPFQRLLSIVGLLASSTEFVSRRAVSDAYVQQRLTFGGATDAGVQQWFAELEGARAPNLAAIGLPPAITTTDPLLAHLVFQGDTTEWRLPLVDRDPAVALSETSPVAPYDGEHNYLWWLTQASRADLTSQHFVNADGTPAPPPTALLYLVLRHALLAALESTSIDAAQALGSQLFQVIDRDPLIANIGEAQHVQRRDYLEVDASRLGLGQERIALADWTLDQSRRPPGHRPSRAERLAEVNDAIAALASLPTARLERLLTEHFDLCSHRLDAWITGIYAQRLALLRERRPAPGLHLGAFGWIENLRPASAGRVRLAPDAIPPGLRDAAGPSVFDDPANGGYVHAPSLMQAATAAVLRNGYLAYASANEPTAFAVNLSSARVRAAMALAGGVRAGQPMAALLGYQLERGLHEGHPGVELDRHIFTLRDRFPLLSGRLTELPPGTHADLVEARNVVDGLALVEATTGQAYPYGIAGLPPAGSPAGAAIAAEVDRLRDALDAVSDVLLSESVHQVVQGNVTRTQAAQLALTSPAAPPEPDIVRTPRSGRVLTFRVALALDGGAVDGWTSGLSPRSRVSAPLNHWLSRHLPPSAHIQWTVQAGASPPAVQSLAGLGLEPLDLVLMSGDRLGDRSSELERFLIRHFRWTHAVTDEVPTVVGLERDAEPPKALRFDFSRASAGRASLAALHPLLTRLRQLLTRSRAAHAADWRRSADESQAAAGDPTGSASGHPRLERFADLTDRIEAAQSGLAAARAVLDAAMSALAPLRAALDTSAATIDDPAWVGRLNDLRGALFAMVPYGVPEALPADGVTVSVDLVGQLVRQGLVVSKIAHDRLARASELLATGFTEALPGDEPARAMESARRNDVLRQSRVDAAKALFGPAFPVLPLFRLTPPQASELAQSLAAPAVDAAAVEEWLLSASRVRPPLADLAWAGAATRWTGHPIGDPALVQLPHRAGTPWIGAAFGDSLPAGEWLSVAVVNAEATASPLQAGLLIDDWTETVPTDRETTGVAFNFNRPNGVAPHALLVAVAPELRGHWTWSDLVGSVHEALDLAKMRAVELDALISRDADAPPPSGAYFQTLPALLTEFTAGRLAVVDFASVVATALVQP